MVKSIIEGASVSAIVVVGTDTYTFFSRIDGFFSIIKNNDTETSFTYHVNLDEVMKNPGAGTPNYDALVVNPDTALGGVTYAVPAKMSQAQKHLLMKSREAWKGMNYRNFE